MVWILLPLGYVTVSSLTANGEPRAVLEAILRLAVIAPVILQTFWIPNDKLQRLIECVSSRCRSSTHQIEVVICRPARVDLSGNSGNVCGKD